MESQVHDTLKLLSIPISAGLLFQVLGHFLHKRHLKRDSAESAVSLEKIVIMFAFEDRLRYFGFISIALLSVVSAFKGLILLWGIVFALSIYVQYIDRALFYVLVTPTTMPGAFFWRNKSFEHYVKHSDKTNRRDKFV